MNTKRRGISMPDILWNQLKAVADAKGISVSEIIRRAAEEYLDGKEILHRRDAG